MASGIYAINSVNKYFADYNTQNHVLQHGTPLLNVWITSMGSTYKRHINKIDIVQKRAIRSVAKA